MMLPCVTALTGRGCTVHGEHLSNCIGIRYDARRQRAVECEGCLPQPATRGMLCESCHQRYEDALDVAVDLITHMRSIERSSAPDGPRNPTRPGSRVIMPVSWITADETWAALHDIAAACDPLGYLEVRPGGTTAYGFGSCDGIDHVRDRVELAVELARTGDTMHLQVAQLAVRFYRAVQRALRAFPLEERPRSLPYARCRQCGHMTLERRPPLDYRDAITVLCINPNCQWEWDPHIVEVDLASYRHQLEADTSATEGATA